MKYWNGSENIPVRAVLQGSVNGPNVGIPVTYKGVEIGSVIEILPSVEEVEVETCLSCVAGSEIRTNSKLVSKDNNILTHRRVEQKTRQ
jgi:ABC-type transporter Mla subunit MlaD